MTDQDILGVMLHFYLAKKDSRIANYHDQQTLNLLKILTNDVGSIELSHKNKCDEKFLSIRSFKDVGKTTEYIMGSGLPFDSDAVLSDIKAKLMTQITKEEYLAKYRELEED